MSKIIGITNISKFIGVSRFKFFNNIFGGGVLDTYTKLLLKMNGSNNSTVFTDECGKAVTVYGNAKISTEQYKFNGSSGYFDGTGDYLSLADSADWDFGSGDFTIDFWFYPLSVASSQICVEIFFSDSAYVQMYVALNRFEIDFASTGGNTPLTANSWYHATLTRNSGTCLFFLNGVQKLSFAKTTDLGGTPTFYIGRSKLPGLYYFNGYLSHLRVTKGQALWTANFTPPSTDADYYS